MRTHKIELRVRSGLVVARVKNLNEHYITVDEFSGNSFDDVLVFLEDLAPQHAWNFGKPLLEEWNDALRRFYNEEI